MRKLFNKIFPGLVSSHPKTVDRDGLTYHQDTNELVTGIVESFHSNGQLEWRGNYIVGEREGLTELFYKNGQLHVRSNYKNGKREGLEETFHRNGQLGIRGNYKNGWQNGLWEFFEEDGTLDSAQTFRNGKRIETNRNP